MSKSDAAQIAAEVEATAARPLWTLPAAWFEPGLEERMAEWIKRNGSQQ